MYQFLCQFPSENYEIFLIAVELCHGKVARIHFRYCKNKCKNSIFPAFYIPDFFNTETLVCSSIISPSVVSIYWYSVWLMVLSNLLVEKLSFLYCTIFLNLTSYWFLLILSLDVFTVGAHELHNVIGFLMRK